MKAEHRKQLETNTLADTLGKIIQSVKHGFNRNAWIVVGVIVAGFVLFLIWRRIFRQFPAVQRFTVVQMGSAR